MFKKKLIIILFVALIIAGLVGPAQAFELGTTDGIWDKANPGGSTPTNIYYHSGPMPSESASFEESNYYSSSYISQSSPPDQTCYYRSSGTGTGIQGTYRLPANDWNSVSYGNPTQQGGWEQSRFAWLGATTEIGPNPELNKPFLLGKFCHINRPISANTTLENVPLKLMVKSVKCDEGWHLKPQDGTIPTSLDLTFVYNFSLDETTNGGGWNDRCFNYGTGDCLCYGPYYNSYGQHVADYNFRACKYHSASNSPALPASAGWPSNGGGGCKKGQTPYSETGWTVSPNDLNYNGCADKVSMTASSETAEFTCVNNANSEITRKYTVSLLGTTLAEHHDPRDDCPKFLASGTPLDYNLRYTSEKTITCMCVYGAITEKNLTPVEIINFMALGSSDGIKLSWETTAETDNLGFNIYRSTSLDGERELVNETVIISDSPGGGMGATYEYLDTTVPAGITYYYWLRDIPLDDLIDPVDFGPLEALRPLN